MFAGDGSSPGEHLPEQFIERLLCPTLRSRLVEVDHEVGMNITIARVAEARYGQSVFALEAGGERK